MQYPQIRFLRRKNWIYLVFTSIFLFSCAALDGVFPKFEPNKKDLNKDSLPTSVSVNKKQSILSEENRILQKEINELKTEVFSLQKKQKEHRENLLLLQEQWEMNFVLLERSVEESLSSKNISQIESQINSEFHEKKTKEKLSNKNKSLNNNFIEPVEDFSLLDNSNNDLQKETFEGNESIEDTSLVFERTKSEVTEEPGFNEIGKVNLNDIEEQEESFETNSSILFADSNFSESNNSRFNEKNSSIISFSDPDLNPPDSPLILIRHPGVKKIYNQGMTALIQKNHLHAINIFKNFTKRFPNNVDSDNAFYWIGRSYFELNELEKAELAFRKVLTLFEHRPTSQGYKTPDSIYMLGKIKFNKNLEKKAAYYWEEVIKRYPGSAASRNAMHELKR